MITEPTPSQLVPVGKLVTIIVRIDDDTATDLAAVLYAVDKRQLLKGCTTLRAWQRGYNRRDDRSAEAERCSN